MRMALAVTLLAATAVGGEQKPDFTGTWEFNAQRSTNVAMMAAMRLTATVEQTETRLVEHDQSGFGGQEQTRDVTYDLTAKPVRNESPMGEACTTVTTWQGKGLVTTWTSEGAVAGTKVTRTESRSLSDDGTTMTVESRRGSSPPIVMVFVRK